MSLVTKAMLASGFLRYILKANLNECIRGHWGLVSPGTTSLCHLRVVPLLSDKVALLLQGTQHVLGALCSAPVSPPVLEASQ